MPRNSHTTNALIGQRVRMRRLMLGISQQKLAAALQLSFQQVQKYEKGTNQISADHLMKIAQCLKVPVQFFFDGLLGATGADVESHRNLPPRLISDFLASPDGLRLAKPHAELAAFAAICSEAARCHGDNWPAISRHIKKRVDALPKDRRERLVNEMQRVLRYCAPRENARKQ